VEPVLALKKRTHRPQKSDPSERKPDERFGERATSESNVDHADPPEN
jgi:hypothetical protein